MIIRPFEAGDIARILVKNNQLLEWDNAKNDDAVLVNTYAFTAVHEGEVIACAGMLPKYYGIADVWAMFSDRTSEFRFTIFKQLKKHIELLKSCDYHYFMTPVRKDSNESIKFIEALGFKRTGELNKYLWKQDYWLYSLYVGEE